MTISNDPMFKELLAQAKRSQITRRTALAGAGDCERASRKRQRRPGCPGIKLVALRRYSQLEAES